MIKGAIQLGLIKICFTDHMDYDYPSKTKTEFIFDPEKYIEKIEFFKHKYKNQITILTGVELGLMPYLSTKCTNFVNEHDFDFVIASSHLVEEKDPYYPDFWQNKSEEEGYIAYFQTIIDNVKAFKDFDVYGHIDYIVRYGPNKNQYYTYKKYADIIDELLKTIIHSGKGIEVNTAGYKYGLSVPHPQPDVLIRYKELGGDLITIGSDGHKPEHIAYDFNKARDLLLDLGFKYYATFEKRKPTFEKL